MYCTHKFIFSITTTIPQKGEFNIMTTEKNKLNNQNFIKQKRRNHSN